MKKGKLIKQGKFWKIECDSFKAPMSVQGDFGLTDDMDGNEVEFDNQGGRINFILYKDRKYEIKQHVILTKTKPFPKNYGDVRGNQRNTPNPNHMENQLIRTEARAPYNFVPMNDVIVDSEFYKNDQFEIERCSFDKYHAELNTGYIELDIKALTKVFIGCGEKDNNGSHKFFAPDGSPRIPGSTMRGMVRTLVEICSWGQFKLFDDKQLFYRTFENSSMGIDFYRSRMVGSNGKPIAKAGYLSKTGRNYSIIPALSSAGLCNTAFYRVNYDMNNFNVPSIGRIDPFKQITVYFKPVKVILQTKHHPALEYAELSGVSFSQDSTNYPKEGKLIASGHIFRKKHMHWVINLPDRISTPKPVDIAIIRTYENDANRKTENFDLLSRLKPKVEVPCFYLEEGGQITAIGHTPFFRLPYENKIGNLLPDVHKNYMGVDIPTAIFGTEQNNDKDESVGFAGRVYFEDSICNTQPLNYDAITYRGQDTAISPKPTAFQLYLKQESVNVSKDELKHYDTPGALLRGNKFYWHKNTNADTSNLLKFNKTRIRFTNLSNIELGALLFVLKLPEGCQHKIGMGKPQGMGSISIEPKLFIEDFEKKYASFMAAFDYKPVNKEFDSIIEVFNDYVIQGLNSQIDHVNGKTTELKSLWDDDRLKELKALLNFNNPPVNTGYMEFMVPGSRLDARGNPKKEFNPKFKNRDILPDATNVT